MRAFSLIELLIVLGTAAILFGISTGAYTTLQKKSNVNLEAKKFESVLNLARNRTLASDTEQSYGVHLETSTNEYILFPGSVYDSSNSKNERFIFPSNVSINSITLRGGGDDIVFVRLSGETAQYGSVVLGDLADTPRLQAICIAGSGSVEVRESCAVDSLEYTGGTTDGDLASFPNNSGFGDPAQSFIVGPADIYVRQADLYLKRTVADPSDVFLEIRETNAVGDVLGRSRIVDGASLPAALDWSSFAFSSPVYLAANTRYFLRLRSLPDSTVAFSGAVGLIHWGYEHSALAPPAYAEGDAWRYVGRNDAPGDQGEQLGPADQYDFSFRILYGIDPPSKTDSRHMEFDLLDTVDRGWSIQGAVTLGLTFHDPPSADVTENIPMASYFNSTSTEFDWEGSVDVNGDSETIRVHSIYLDANNTILSIHRDQGVNQKAVDIGIDGKAIVSYAADGTPSVGAWGGAMIFR